MKTFSKIFSGMCLCAFLAACGGGSDAAGVIGGGNGNTGSNPPIAEAQVWLPEQLEVVTNETN